MPFEIDFLPVGNGDRCGDAIAVRYCLPGAYTVMIYDGGTLESGEQLVNHVCEYYETDFVDHVVCSHPDADHACGLSVVLEELRVGTLWLHRPWHYSQIIIDYFRDGRITSQSLKDKLQTTMAAAYELEQIALEKEIAIRQPFQGTMIGDFYVLSPSQEWYVHTLIADFEKSPEKKLTAAAIPSPLYTLLQPMIEAAVKAGRWVNERWDLELLRENPPTSAENDSSAILFAYMEEYREGILFTGDSGVQALNRAMDYLDIHRVNAPDLIKFIQVPHHGSRHNVSTSVLDRILGKRLTAKPNKYDKVAFVSASKGSTTHPRKMVVNAFLRRGAQVIATQGSTKCHCRGMPAREGWTTATPLDFSDRVEGWY
jgi:beta-lactamase superfamily II metal-dependent hydrolase